MNQIKASEKEKQLLKTYLLQFLNLEKRYPLLPGIRNTGAMAGLFGITEDEMKEARTKFDQHAKEAALELLEEEEIMEWIERLPFDQTDTIVALGDSITDDLQGWFTLLGYLLEMASPEAEFTFINSGISYDTSSDALRRLDRDVLAHDPDWVIVALGTFDAQRLNVAPDRPLVPLAEFWENTNTIEQAVKRVTGNPPVWITPPPVIPGMLKNFRLFDFSIHPVDLAGIREILSGKTGYIIDPRGTRMGKGEPEAWNYLNDGLHPSLSGHSQTVRALLRTLATATEREGSRFKTGRDDY